MTDTREAASRLAYKVANWSYESKVDAIDEALRNERERCAKIAETKAADRCMKHQKSGRGVCGYEIANAIRAAIRNDKGE